ncbi:arylsulfatase [Candidatus Sumerlaeota bacterium]|nr:arylsulfatase [Candidatus Sumerlaeota bacterium]
MRCELSRREVLALGLSGLAAACARTSAASQSRAREQAARSPKSSRQRPNILLLMSDQHRGDCIGADGNAVIHTPNLDQIAREGALFRRAYSCTPTCTPARAALLTGLGPWRNGLLGYGRVGEKYPIEMPQALRDAGYWTMGIGKMHWHPQRNGHGFHEVLLDESSRAESPEFRSDYRSWFYCQAPNLNPDATGIGWNDYLAKPYALPEKLHPTNWMGETAARFIETYNRPEPFFLKVSFARPHSPYDPPERFWRKYQDADLPKAAVGKWAAKYAERSSDRFDIWHGDLGPQQVRTSRQGYYGSVTFVDEQIGRILEALDKRGRLDETLIIYTADHGDMTGDHNLWRKSYPYEPSARIPMIMRWPTGLVAAERGQVCWAPVELRDILPTFLAAASAPGGETLDGGDLLELARGNLSSWRKYIDLEHDICYGPENHWSALTGGRTKYIFNCWSGEEQLFDLEHDPHELNDLAGDASHQGQLREWRERLVAHLAPRGERFVRNGKLMLRRESNLYSPNFPGCSCHPRLRT